MWSSLVKIQYTELKLCENDPVVKNSIYSNGGLDFWPNDPKINRVLPQGNHVAKFGKDPIYRTKVIVGKPVWTPALPNHIIRAVSRRAFKKKWMFSHKKFILWVLFFFFFWWMLDWIMFITTLYGLVWCFIPGKQKIQIEIIVTVVPLL
jgi:hypothetical protein